MNRLEEVQAKLERIYCLLNEQKADCVFINQLANYYWLTAGGEGRVGMDLRNAASSLLVTRQEVHVLTNNIEAPRLEQEALAGLGFIFHTWPWYEPARGARLQEELMDGMICLSDTPGPGLIPAVQDIRKLRYALLLVEQERLVVIGAAAARAVEDSLKVVRPGMDEMEVTGLVSARLFASDLTPTVLLVGSDERQMRYRHPLPTTRKLEKYVMLACCCRRGGLTVSLSRSIYFGKLPSELAARQQAAAGVDGAMIARTRPGAAVKDILQAGIQAYAGAGYPGEWEFHHQGGAISYENRDYLALPQSEEMVQAKQAFAWNITIQGTKSEDTFLVEEAGPRIVTAGGGWPAITVEVEGTTISRPAILES